MKKVIIIALGILLLLVSGCGGENIIATYEGTGSKEITGVKVPLDDGFADFKVRHKAEEGFHSWGLYYPDTDGTLVDANNGLGGTESVVESYSMTLDEITYVLDVWADDGCSWTIEIID